MSVPNRLTTAHLLLWIAGTGLALACVQAQRPPPPESIGFASFLTAPGADVKAETAKARQGLWRKWQNQYLVGLSTAPIYGAAVASIGLAIWRSVTGRFAFPAQPGHWVLLEVGIFWGLATSRDQLHLLPQSDDGRDFVVASLMLSVAAATAMLVGQSVWRLPMITAACGLLLVCTAYVISFSSKSIEAPGMYGAGLFVIATVPILALVSAILDLADRRRFDIFHWVGIATFFGVVAHFLARVGVARI